MSRALRVIVVDDDIIIADTLAQILRLNAIEAIAVHSGEAAVALANAFRPDAAIIDVVLGSMNGIEAALAILLELPACRIILFSGNQDTSALLAKASEDGHAFCILAKPVHPLELLDALGPVPPRLAAI